ncbi:MAG: hypothetical protein KUG71_07945, partial [Porticoccaceae bacterium]|nr:hypothetical protein [Porticoccaceae bacterium]
MTNSGQLKDLLQQDIYSPWDKLYKAAIKRLLVQYEQWQGRHLVYDDDLSINDSIKYVNFLLYEISAATVRIDLYQSDYATFYSAYTRAVDTIEQDIHLLKFCKVLGANAKQLRADKKALNRWFDVDAVTERSLRLQHDEEVQLSFVVSRLPVFMSVLMTGDGEAEKLVSWQRFQFDKVLMPLLLYKGDERVRVAAFKALSQLILPLSSASIQALPADIVRYIYRFAMDKSQPIWNQVEALHLLGNINPQELITIFAGRLEQSEQYGRDDMFFRYYMVLEIGRRLSDCPELIEFLPRILADPSPYVRKAFAEILVELPYDTGLDAVKKLFQDECSPVRAAMLLQIPNLIEAHQRVEPFFGLLLRQLEIEQDDFVIRAGLHVACASYQQVIALSLSRAQNIQQPLTQLESLLTSLHTEADSTKVRRWAAQTREQLWAGLYQGHGQRDVQRHAPLTTLFDLEPGQSQRLNKAQRASIRDTSAMRWLATKTANDFGFDIGSKRLTRDSKAGFRLWRFLFEWRNPATDKRQNYNHQKGRLYSGLDYIPAHHLAEVSATKVPGEPLHISEEGGWRPYLPLVDQVISSLDQNWPTQPLKIYSSEGITYLLPPTGFFKRLYARIQLTLRFAEYAKLRNWSCDDNHGPDAYARALTKLGFTLSITSHLDSQGKPYPKDSKIAHFFPAIVPVFLLPWWSEFQAYFFSVYQNTITQLT